MPFPGEERYREALTRAVGHESMSAMVRCEDLAAALVEIDRLRSELGEANAKLVVAYEAVTDIANDAWAMAQAVRPPQDQIDAARAARPVQRTKGGYDQAVGQAGASQGHPFGDAKPFLTPTGWRRRPPADGEQRVLDHARSIGEYATATVCSTSRSCARAEREKTTRAGLPRRPGGCAHRAAALIAKAVSRRRCSTAGTMTSAWSRPWPRSTPSPNA